jgi:hypothetical protein
VVNEGNTAPEDVRVYDATQRKWVRRADTADGRAAREAADLLRNTPTLSDMLMRDIVSGQVRSARKGARRGAFSGTAQSPYALPPLGG